MENLLEWIEREQYVLYKDGRWYKKGAFCPWKHTKYYTHKQLIELFTRESIG